MISEKYPDAYDVKELIGMRSTSLAAIRTFTASRGILIAGRGKEVYGSTVSRLLLDHQGYLDLRYYAQGGDTRTSISGFNIKVWATPPKTIQDIYNDIVRLRNQLSESRLPGKKLTAIEIKPPEIIGDSIVSRYSYQRFTPGKVELLSRSNETVDFSISQIGDDTWRVVCLPKYNQDVETLQKILQKADKLAYQLYTISLDDFAVADRIAFFDRLLEYYSLSSPEWSLRHVCGIVVKKAEEETSEEIFEIDSELSLSEVINMDEQSVKQVQPSDLRSITQAALEGQNLRTNSFVKECERVGFYFSSMSLEVENKSTSEVIKVQIRFKLSPKMFEVILLYTAVSSEIGEQETSFTSEREQQILSEFWGVSHAIWHEIKDKVPAQIPGGRQTVINLS